MEFGVLGPLVVWRDGAEVPVGAAKQRALLALLLLRRGEFVPTGTLVDELWGARPPATAVKTTQVYVAELRKLLGKELIETRPGGYLLRAGRDAVDAFRFEQLIARARDLMAGGEMDAARGRVSEALALWRGPPLAEFQCESFARDETRKLEELRLVAQELRLEAELALGGHAEAVPELEGLIREQPLRENPRRLLMLALYRSGRQADALRAYRDARTTLLDELGLDPSESLQQLETAILNHDSALDLAAPPSSTRARTNLPVPASSFVGRERELVEVLGLVRDEGARLLTLSGPGGTGKTRLAIETAAKLLGEFSSGVFWVGLAAIRDAGLVVETIAQTLGTKQELSAYIRDRELLLVLDNLEQVIGAAPDLGTLLRACPHLRLLVTSRELLRIDGEVVYPVPALIEGEAEELFCSRARVEPDGAVAELCGRLDNLPLALELAAARVSVLSPAQILERLSQRLDLFMAGRDADPRQQSLRATIGWSYELLSGGEQRLFSRLAVFRGGCTLEAAELVADAELDNLQSLLDKSLVRRTGDRFWMLETIREYALEQLEASGETRQICDRHAEHYLALSEQGYIERFDRGLTWTRRLESDHDNLRAALDDLQDRDPRRYLGLAGALGWFWDARSHFTEGARRLEHAIAVDTDPGPSLVRALTSAGAIESNRGFYNAGVTTLEQAYALSCSLDDETEWAAVENQLGWALFLAGEDARALELFEQNVENARRVHHQGLVNRALFGICMELVATGDAVRAEPLALELQALTHRTEDVSFMSAADHLLADCAMYRQDYVLAERHRLAALESALVSGDVHQQCSEVCGISLSAAGLGRHEDALRLDGAVAAKLEELGVSQLYAVEFVESWRRQFLGPAREALGEARADAAQDEGRTMTWEQAIELALRGATAPASSRTDAAVTAGA